MPDLPSMLLQSGLSIRAGTLLFILGIISLFLAFIKYKYRSLIYLQIPLISLQLFVMLPLWDLADILRHKPIREISKRVLSVRYSNEPIAMVGVRKPSLHFYTKQIITYESYSDIGLVNLSDRLRFEVREKWKNIRVQNGR